jgi:hypothetical protein
LEGQRAFRNYLAGAALAFGVVLLASQILQLMYGGLSPAEREPLYSLILNIYLASHLAGGFLGGYLVARVKMDNYVQTGTVVAVLAYMFEFAYNIIVEGAWTDLYAMLSLLIGGIVGAVFFKSRMERGRLAAKKDTEDKPPPPEPEKVDDKAN